MKQYDELSQKRLVDLARTMKFKVPPAILEISDIHWCTIWMKEKFDEEFAIPMASFDACEDGELRDQIKDVLWRAFDCAREKRLVSTTSGGEYCV